MHVRLVVDWETLKKDISGEPANTYMDHVFSMKADLPNHPKRVQLQVIDDEGAVKGTPAEFPIKED